MEKKLKKVYPIEDNCISCRHCEVACTMFHSESKDPVKAYKLEGLIPRVTVEVNGAVSIAIMCRHCKHPFCMDACTSGAIRQEDDGSITLDESKCVGCWNCVLACPFGAIHPDIKRKKAYKCDLCNGRKFPACVQACPNGALTYR